MTDQLLLQMILAEPELHAPRLVLADWWEQYGTDEQRQHAELESV